MSELPNFNLSDIDRALCRKSYQFYVEYTNKDLGYKHGAFTRYLTKTVQDFIETKTGNAYDIMLLSVPPQHSKSTTITETLPSWVLGKYPKWRVVEVSYNDDFAKRFTRKNRDKIVQYNPFGISIGSPDTSNEFKLSNGIGSFISRGIMSGITGEPCELLIIDDPIKNRQDADSATMRSNLFEEWLNSYKSRLAPGAKVILIMTRWHKDDLYGQILATEKNVTKINFPVECEEDTDILGRHRGDTLFPEINKTKEWWLDFKASYITSQGSRALNALYYGRPSNAEGGLFKREWFIKNLYHILPKYAFKCISVDATFKDAKNSDYVAIQVWVKSGKDYYLVKKIKRIMGFVDTLQVLEEIIRDNNDYDAIYIEDKANGSAIIDVLNRKYRSVIPIQTEGGKEARANAVAPMIEAGNVHLRQEDGDMIDECCDFPNSDHDDQVDAMDQALNKMRNIVAEILPPKDEDYISYDDEINSVLNYTGR